MTHHDMQLSRRATLAGMALILVSVFCILRFGSE